MVRVLHLLPKSPDFQTETAIAQLANPASDEIAHTFRILGETGDNATPIRAIAEFRRKGIDADLIQAWGMRALCVAALGATQRILFSPTEFPTRRSIGWVRSIMNYRDVQVICATDTMRRAFVERGVPIVRCHMIRPGVDFSRINKRRDDALRAKLGFSKEDRVLLAIGESDRASGHTTAAFVAVVLHVLNRRNKLLLWGRGPMARHAARFVQHLQQPDLCVIATERLGNSVTFEQLLPATDVALITPDRPTSTLPIAICMAAALPIVGLVDSTVSELLQDRHNALMVGKRVPRLLAQRVVEMCGDANRQGSLCDMARAEAHESFSLTRFTGQFRAIYQQAAVGAAVEVPVQAPGAGARFHTVG